MTHRPRRLLALAQLANSVGDGAYYVTSALYFTRVAGLAPARVGLGLTLAWAVGSLLGVPLGRLADRRGPRGMSVLLALGTSAAVACFLLVHGFVPFVLTACVYASAQSGLAAARQALLAGLVPAGERTGLLARLQSTLNGGLAVGAALGGLALSAGTAAAYRGVLLLDTLCFLVCALVLLRLPATAVVPTVTMVPAVTTVSDVTRVSDVTTAPDMTTVPAGPPVPAVPHASAAPPARPAPPGGAVAGGRRIAVLGDRRYVLVALLNAVLLLRLPLLSLALPLWITERTGAPAWLASGLFVLNTVAVTLFQVRAARAVTGLGSALRVLRRSGLVMFASCAVFALSAGRSAWPAAATLIIGAVLQVVAEMQQSAGSWQLSFDLAPADRTGEYQGFFGTGVTVARTLGPLLVTWLLLGWGTPGWLLLGALMPAAAYAMGPAARLTAGRRTPRETAEPLPVSRPDARRNGDQPASAGPPRLPRAGVSRPDEAVPAPSFARVVVPATAVPSREPGRSDVSLEEPVCATTTSAATSGA
ncbi:MFS transporter [Streptomyces naphthomycinicus]|uniref:MFS transporter n=1 Tax=Streptomyces naphthomycinicus TaxID=2872625 RepID=UPI001CEC4ABE|nr:MFS transporter [Streptomyces sp. TML10]